ncbi:hypothetical protein C1646_763483 [Rhizophagus diaphanus]|nr:hypothetical protein C1646_763483 [Rhizophagus diaphanus] [Rhizophagus sp. MUCL 43196]
MAFSSNIPKINDGKCLPITIGYRRRDKVNRTESYRPWNAAVHSKSISEPTYDPGSGSFTSLDESVDIDEHQMFEIDTNTQPQSPLNAASLKKIDTIINGSLKNFPSL